MRESKERECLCAGALEQRLERFSPLARHKPSRRARAGHRVSGISYASRWAYDSGERARLIVRASWQTWPPVRNACMAARAPRDDEAQLYPQAAQLLFCEPASGFRRELIVRGLDGHAMQLVWK